MATLWEIDKAITECIDWETGEIVDFEKLSQFQMERGEKIEAVALWVKNLVSDAEAYKKEKDAFAERQKSAEDKAKRLKIWIGQALNGEKMTTDKVAISFRKSESVEIQDENEFVCMATNEGLEHLLSYKEPTPNKPEIKAAIKNGAKIAGAELVQKQNITIK